MHIIKYLSPLGDVIGGFRTPSLADWKKDVLDRIAAALKSTDNEGRPIDHEQRSIGHIVVIIDQKPEAAAKVVKGLPIKDFAPFNEGRRKKRLYEWRHTFPHAMTSDQKRRTRATA